MGITLTRKPKYSPLRSRGVAFPTKEDAAETAVVLDLEGLTVEWNSK